MYNLATIYRFNTPFLDLKSEKNNIKSVLKKIVNVIEFNWMDFKRENKREWNYYKVKLIFNDNLWRIELFYINKIENNIYHLPIFKLNIYLNRKYLLNNSNKEKAVNFLNNIFECYDWLNEKEFLIDIDNSLYYYKWLFSWKIYPNYDFSDIEKTRNFFESKNWIKLVEDFIKKFSNSTFELTYKKSNYYHTLHGIFLYFIYLVFLMYQNIENINNAKDGLNNDIPDWVFEWERSLMKKRLLYVEELHYNTFEKYKARLELFFKLF